MVTRQQAHKQHKLCFHQPNEQGNHFRKPKIILFLNPDLMVDYLATTMSTLVHFLGHNWMHFSYTWITGRRGGGGEEEKKEVRNSVDIRSTETGFCYQSFFSK